MALGERRRVTRICKVLRPVPIPYLWHVFEVLANVDMVLVKLPVEHVNDVRYLRPQSRNIFKRIDRQMEPAEFIEDHHVKRGGRRPLIDEAAHMKTAFVRTAMHNAVNGPTVGMERKNHRYVRRKQS